MRASDYVFHSVYSQELFITGSFENQITNLENNMPLARSEAYVVPTRAQQADFARLLSMNNAKDLTDAAQLAARNSYTLTCYVDQADHDAASYLLREQKPIQKGWGLYAFRVGSTSNIMIESPHPRYDKHTPSVALDLYRALQARALLVAGAHRNANSDGLADVAHAKESIFQSVHIALSREIQAESGNVIILQVHGFHSTNHPGYPDLVFGLGNNPLPEEVTLAEKMKDALTQQGITAGICTGATLEALCAETNVQNAVTKQGAFMHIELDETLRQDDTAFLKALVQVFAK